MSEADVIDKGTIGNGELIIEPYEKGELQMNEDEYSDAVAEMDDTREDKEMMEDNINQLAIDISNQRTKSEINDYGDDEFNPWVIGATI